MGIFDASNATTGISMLDDGQAELDQVLASSPSEYSWITTGDRVIAAASFTDNIVDGPSPSGTIDSVAGYATAGGPLQYAASGFEGSLADMLDSPEGYWRAILAGDTEIVGPDDSTVALTASGDFIVTNEFLFAGDDTFTTSVYASAASQPTILYGDAFQVTASLLAGGADTLLIQTVGDYFGDAGEVTGGALVGGDDVFEVESDLSETALAIRIYGDAGSVALGAAFSGGDDTVDVFGANVALISGDAGTVADGAVSAFGNDSIAVFGDAGLIVGDAVEIASAEVGGDDEIFLVSLGSGSVVSGDFGAVSGEVSGGADLIEIDGRLPVGETPAGGVTVSGDADAIAAGGQLSGGNDSIEGSGFDDTISGEADRGAGAIVGLGADVINGFSGDDAIYGETRAGRLSSSFLQGGDDVIDGGRGRDTVYGQAGDDTIDGGRGSDQLDGGFQGLTGVINGVNTVTFDAIDQSVTVDLSRGYAVGQGADTLVNFQNVIGSTLDDKIAGAGTTNALYGIDGDDLLNGRSGDDALYGGQGADQLIGGAGIDVARYDDAAYGDLRISLADPSTNTGAAQGDSFTGVEGLAGGVGNDTLFGDGANNTLDGLDGSDQLAGGLGADSLRGGEGVDYARYDDASGGIVVSLANPALNTGVAAGDRYNSIEGVIAGDGADRVTGNAFINYLYGGAGADTISGGGGADQLFGQGGSDVFLFDSPLGASNVDAVRDFVVSADTIGLSAAVFTNAGPVGPLAAGAFALGTAATDADDRIIYDAGSGALIYDADGTGATQSVLFATLSANLALTAANFQVV